MERSTERLACHLVTLGHHVRIVTQQLPGTAAREIRGGVIIRRYPGSERFTALAAGEGEFTAVDVVCIFGVGHDPSVAWWEPILNADLNPAGVRFLKVGTDGDLQRRCIPPEFLSRLDGVLCQTPQIAADANQSGVRPENCFSVRNGISIAHWRAGLPAKVDARRETQVPPNAYVVLGLGRFTHRKRFGDLIAAFEKLTGDTRQERPVLALHGSDFDQDDGEEHELRAFASEAGADIRFVPSTVDPKVTLAACDVMASLAEREGAPNIFIEAFATGRPVLATDLPGHRIYIRHTREGLLVPVGDIDAAADGLRYLDEHRCLREGMGLTASHAALHFDIAHTAMDYVHAFSVAVTRKRSHS